jgi:tetratricopeptide (TPR) repeat protein
VLGGEARNQLRYSLALRLRAVGRPDDAAAELRILAVAFGASWSARAHVDLAQLNFRRGNLQVAESQLLRAAQLASEAGDVWGELLSRGNRCRLLETQGKTTQARSCTRAVITRAIAANEPRLAAGLRYNLGGLEVMLANPDAARAAFDNALAFFEYSQDLSGQGAVAGAMALLERRLGHQERALAFQARALAAARQTLDRRGIALATVNLANLYLMSGDVARARPLVEESAALGQELNDLNQWRRALAALSGLEYHAMNYGRAEIYRRQALALAEELNNQRAILADKVLLADILLAQGQNTEALAEIAAIEPYLTAAPNLTGRLLTIKGQALLATGETTAARETLINARQTNQRSDQRVVELSTLITLAELELQENRAAQANDWITAARRLSDEMRLTINDPGLRLQFSRAFADVVALELKATIAMGGDNIAERSFIVVERNRARTLVDLLARTGAVPPVPEPALEQQLIEQRERLALTRVRLEVAIKPKQIDSMTRAVQQLRQAVELTEAQGAESYPNFPTNTTTDIDVAQLQAQLEPDTWLVEFSLGEERSLAWRVTKDAVELFTLPPRQQLEDLAREIHQSMNPPQPMASLAPTLAKLADLLLSPLGAGKPPR